MRGNLFVSMSTDAPLQPEEISDHAESVRALARSLVRDAADADDVVQDAALAAMTQPPSEGTPHRAWFVRVVRNLAARRHRGERRRVARERGAAKRESGSPTSHAAHELELHARLVAAVSELDDPYRTAIVLRYFDGLPPREIARRMGVPDATASTWVHRGLATLRGRLDRERDDWRALFWLVLDGPPDGAAAPANPLLPLSQVAGLTAMATKKTVGVIAAILLALAVTAGAVALRPPGDTDDSQNAATDQTQASASREARRGERASNAPDAQGDRLPPPFDLTTADRELDLFGRVIDADGQPIAGAVLTPLRRVWYRLGVTPPADEEDPLEGGATRSARDGTFRMRFAAGAVIDLRVGAPGFAEFTLEKCSAGEQRTITLTRGAILRVRCVARDGAPVPGVLVTVRRRPHTDPIRQDRSRTTDHEGRAEFGDLVEGITTVYCRHDRLGSPDSSYPWITTREPTEIEITLPPGRAISGRVTDADTGQPIPGAQVVPNWFSLEGVPVDATGRYRLTGLGNVSLFTAQAPGYDPLRRRPGNAETLDFQLQAGGTVKGRLLRPDGSPAGGARVGARSPFSSETSGVGIGTLTDADGRFAIAGMRRGATCTLTALAAGCGKLLLDYEQIDPVVDLGDIELGAARSISGVAADSKGRPIPDVWVSLSGGEDDRGRLGAKADQHPVQALAEHRTDDLGRFRFVGLAPGSYKAWLRVPGAPRLTSVALTLPPDRDLDDVQLQTTGARTLTLHVTNAAGAPLPGTGFSASGMFGQDGRRSYPLTGATDQDGRVVLRGLPPSNMTLLVNNLTAESSYVMERLGPLVPEDQVIHVILRRAVFVSGVMRDADGAAVPHLGIAAISRADDEQVASTWGDDDGAFAIKVPEGVPVDLRLTGNVVVRKKDLTSVLSCPSSGTLPGIVPPAEDLVVRVTEGATEGDRTLDVVVRDSAGRPVADVRVRASGRASFLQGARGRTDAEGRVHFENLPGVQMSISISGGGPPGTPLPLDVPPAGLELTPTGQEVTLDYVRGVELRGLVEDADGNPVPRAFVHVTTHDYRNYTTRCDDEGRFRCGALRGRGHSLRAIGQVGGHEVEIERQGVVPGPDDIRLRLVPQGDGDD